MAYDPALDALMPDAISIRRGTSLNNYGERDAVGTATSYQARIVFSASKIIVATGEEASAAGQAWISGSVPADIKTSDILTLPDGNSPEIMRVDIFPDEDGEHHRVVWFG